MDSIFCGNFHLTNDIDDNSITNELAQQLLQLKTILANSTFNITEIIGKSIENYADDYTMLNDDPEFEIWYQNENGRISLAHERLHDIPKCIADQFAERTHTLDLSDNNLKDLTFLSNFHILHTLILDNNVSIDVKTLPSLPNLRILWLNKCGISQLSKWLERINNSAPHLQQLSLMGNPGTGFDRCRTSIESNEYMMYVIGRLPNLNHLDDVKITDDQRAMANKAHLVHNTSCSSINFQFDFSSALNMQTIWGFDTKSSQSIKSFSSCYVNIHSQSKCY